MAAPPPEVEQQPAAPPVDESQQVPQQQVPQTSEAFDFSTFSTWMFQQDQRAIRQEQRDHFIMDQNVALFRSQRGMHQTY